MIRRRRPPLLLPLRHHHLQQRIPTHVNHGIHGHPLVVLAHRLAHEPPNLLAEDGFQEKGILPSQFCQPQELHHGRVRFARRSRPPGNVECHCDGSIGARSYDSCSSTSSLSSRNRCRPPRTSARTSPPNPIPPPTESCRFVGGENLPVFGDAAAPANRPFVVGDKLSLGMIRDVLPT